MDGERNVKRDKRFLVDLAEMDDDAVIMKGKDGNWYCYKDGGGFEIKPENKGEVNLTCHIEA